MALFSESLLSSKTSQGLFLAGKNQLLSAVMLSEINTRPLISSSTSLENSKLFSQEMTEQLRRRKSTTTKALVVLEWVCITLTRALNASPIAASLSHFKESILFISLLKIRSWKSTTADLRIHSKKFTKKSIERNSRPKKFGMSIGSLMIWLPTW